MTADRIVIEELFLQLPGVSVDVAGTIAAEVADRVGRGVSAALPARSLGALDLHLTMRQGASRDEMVDTVSQAIVKALLR